MILIDNKSKSGKEEKVKAAKEKATVALHNICLRFRNDIVADRKKQSPLCLCPPQLQSAVENSTKAAPSVSFLASNSFVIKW